MPTNDEPLGKRRRSMDPQTCSSDNHGKNFKTNELCLIAK